MNSENYGNVVQGGSVQQPTANKGLVLAAKVFIGVGVAVGLIFAVVALINICMAEVDYSIALLYTISMVSAAAGAFFGSMALHSMSAGKRPSIPVMICVLIFNNLIGGILLLCTKPEDFQKTDATKKPVARLRLGTAAKVHTIIGAVASVLLIILSIVCLVLYAIIQNRIISSLPYIIAILCCGIIGLVSGILSMVKMHAEKQPAAPLAILVLIFTNLVAGILLCMTREADFQKQKYGQQPEAKCGLVTVAKVYIILGFIFIGIGSISLGVNLRNQIFKVEDLFAENLLSNALSGLSGIGYIFIAIIHNGISVVPNNSNGISSIYSLISEIIIYILEAVGGVSIIADLIITAIICIALYAAGVVFGVIALRKMAEREYSTPIAICTLIFLTLCSGIFGLVGGILWLCSKGTKDAEIEGLNAIGSEQTSAEIEVK